jgi:ABC-2 type transport system permease protein
MISILQKHGFLFSELVKRDFKKKYKNTYLGVLWSLLSPLLTLFVMSLVFRNFFGRDQPHYTTYIFCGNIVFSFFSDSTGGGMGALLANSEIFSKIDLPKYLFLLSRNVSSIINFGLTFAVFCIFCIIDGVNFGPSFFSLIIPIASLFVFCIGIGLILSALFVFFRDMQYLWSIFTMLLMYMSAIFYTVDSFSEKARHLFLLNPIYVYIKYFRTAVIDGVFPSLQINALCIGYAAISLFIGCAVYRKNSKKIIYYI